MPIIRVFAVVLIVCAAISLQPPLASHSAGDADGDLELSFGQNGFVVTDIPGAIRRLTL